MLGHNKAIPKCRGKFFGGIYQHSICKRKNEVTQTLDNLREKSTEGKNYSAKNERDIPLNQSDYKEFSTLCYRFNSIRFDSLSRKKRLSFIAEG